MQFKELELEGAFLVELEPHRDERGFFARSFAAEVFAARGLPTEYPHWNLSRNSRAGTLRGMHYAALPSAESKIVRCVRGAIHDVIVDVRPGSRTFGRAFGVDLTAENARALFIPPGVGHGFLTLEDETDVLYQMGEVFRPESARGFRWNDPAFAIDWPAHRQIAVISERDRTYPDFVVGV